MIFKLLASIAVLISFSACSGGSEGLLSSTGTTSTATAPIYTGVQTAANSCAELGAYTTLDLCRQTTFAQCYPATRNIQNMSTVCYYPVSGWQACAGGNQANWAYGAYGNWCFYSPGIFHRSRTATCNRAVAACDCTSVSATTESCTNNGTPGVAACPAMGPYIMGCNNQPTPTPVPAITPAGTPSWCTHALLNYGVISSNHADATSYVRQFRDLAIKQKMLTRGYIITGTRSQSPTISSGGSFSAADLNNFVFETNILYTGYSCPAGQKMVSVTIVVSKGNTSLAIKEKNYMTCTSNYESKLLSLVDQALNEITIPYCF
jgi:hypothetical protein